MDTIIVDEGFRDYSLLDALNQEAFPEEERVATADLIAYSLAENRELLAFYDECGQFLGFAVLMVSSELIYLPFLAVKEELRGFGLGSRMLKSIERRHTGRSLVLEIERLDEPCSNLLERKARRRFYEKNGFAKTQYRLEYVALSFDILSKGTFPKEAYRAILSSISQFDFKLVKLSIQ